MYSVKKQIRKPYLPTYFEWTNPTTTVNTLPAVNIVENENEFVLEMAAPGLKKSDFNIQLEQNKIIIKSDVTEEQSTQYNRREFNYQSFQRSFNVNTRLINQNEIKADYTDGLLKLTLPKREETKETSRMIEIS